MSGDVEIEWTPKARRILASAGELFYAHGIHAIGVDVIAAHAGVTKRTLYDRFGSKERLVTAYLVQRDADWREHLQHVLSEADSTPVARLEAVFAASQSWTELRGGTGCSMINAHAEINDPSHPAYPVIVGQKEWMLDLFTGIAEQADASNPQDRGRALMLLHEGALVTAGMGVLPQAYSLAATTAVQLLGERAERSR